jgi:2-polyprenyl-3-methyl-5-hydroxy-6-metoxy-1,4-benzoquinol methylase
VKSPFQHPAKQSHLKVQQDFRSRSHQPEMMDDDAVGFEEFRRCLHDLERVNACTLAYRPTLHWLKRVWRDDQSRQPVSILDIGCGGGGMLRKIWQWARRRGSATCLTGVDLNPWSKASAERVTPPDARIQYETSNIFSFDPERRADFIISSLFTHHLSDDEVVTFLRWMDHHATQGWFINDLHRHPVPFFLIRYVTRLLRFSPMVQHDGPVSVARAFTAADWRRLIAAAGIPAARIRINWFFPFRYCVAGRPDSSSMHAGA